jgi:hypothetical protein
MRNRSLSQAAEMFMRAVREYVKPLVAAKRAAAK